MARLVVHTQMIDRRRKHCRLTGLGQLSTQKGLRKKRRSYFRWGYNLQYWWKSQLVNIHLFLAFLSKRQNIKARNFCLSVLPLSSVALYVSPILSESTASATLQSTVSQQWGLPNSLPPWNLPKYQTTSPNHILCVPIPSTPSIGAFFGFTRMFGSNAQFPILCTFGEVT